MLIFLLKNKQQSIKSSKPDIDRYYTQLNNLISQKEIDNTQYVCLFVCLFVFFFLN